MTVASEFERGREQSLPGAHLLILRAAAIENLVVDESHWYGRATGTFLGIPGGNRPIDFRILHVCEIRDDKISRENVWLDTAAIMQQLTAPA
ncbi:ester cyclase [Nocardia sp. XZ_19_369]|uniref:ester cyclase n=1 Tax=Nocardia sp. XZ_19_369 TaxID=2769487 RepID=UPI0027D2F20E|nr:ester cyclase [Nocardia sp. XZ_19_369]